MKQINDNNIDIKPAQTSSMIIPKLFLMFFYQNNLLEMVSMMSKYLNKTKQQHKIFQFASLS